MEELAPFSPEDLASIQRGLEEIRAGRVLFAPPIHAIEQLMPLWGGTAAAPEPAESRREAGDTSLRVARALADLQSGNAKSPAGTWWSMGMTEEFTAASRDAAPTRHAGVVEAMAHISLMPTLPMGETVKPLTGMLNGLWRYRLGDARLVYRPDAVEKRVALVTLVPRDGSR